MDPNKLFEELTWADLLIIGDELKTVWEFDCKRLKHKDLWTVCKQLKMKKVKNISKEAKIQRIVAIYKIKQRYHFWKILRAMWSSLNVEHKAALSHFTSSGMHSSNFHEFINGRHDIYYLWKQLESKPNLVSTVVADLPEEVFMESIEVLGELPQQPAHQPSASMKKVVRL